MTKIRGVKKAKIRALKTLVLGGSKRAKNRGLKWGKIGPFWPLLKVCNGPGG